VHLIDVGTGLSILVQGHTFNLLYDGGSNDDFAGISGGHDRDRLIAYLFAALGPSGPPEWSPPTTRRRREQPPGADPLSSESPTAITVPCSAMCTATP
jgi:hypothetical protein